MNAEREARAPSPMRRFMRGLAHLMPARADGTNPTAVRVFHWVDGAREAFGGRARRGDAWPVTGGAYEVGNPQGTVAICTLTSDALYPELSRLPGVAIAGRVYVPNLGIEKIIVNVTANPRIRFLLLCGTESPVFHPGEALRRLRADGVDEQSRIIGARGHLPVLSNVSAERIEAFRAQVELVDLVGETDPTVIGARVEELTAADAAPFAGAVSGSVDAATDYTPIRPGGRRQPLAYDPHGYFVITLDREAGRIVLRHHRADNSPAHEMRGRSAEAMLLGLLRDDLVSQMSHAGYLGGELAKAEAALRLGLRYEQDQPLRKPGDTAD
ncbi:DUF4346 domain-containing protein [Propionicicella superfundia]|uniref:DUF4346 domain-containing protein n=1 Tax=Propionicicella superfundia TaxID=348582 RepID=UPI0003F872D0|nr:hypothetical protein [Propionicicella superfundia]